MKKPYILERLLISTLVLLFSSGCTIKRALPSRSPLEHFTSPEIGKTNKVEIGQSMFSHIYAKKDVIKVHGRVVANHGKRSYIIKDTKLLKTIENYNAICYSWFCTADTNNDGYLDSWWKSKKQFKSMIDNDYKLLDKKVPYTLEYTYSENSFKYDVLYQGRVNNRISISYREFANNIARPAFTQNIEYEVIENADTIIGFKGLRIKILKTTNYDITYQVLKDYD
jgi:hypothetical protein